MSALRSLKVPRIRIPAIMLALTGGLLAWLFVFGPAFPWSPVKPGYNVVATKEAIIVTKDRSHLDSLILEIDSLMKQQESLHGLKYGNKLKIVVCQSQTELNRFIPWINTRGVGGVALLTGDVVYINSPKIRSERKSELEYLKHEISHSLIHQNTSFKNTFETRRQKWVLEGAATFFGGPVYHTKGAFSRQFKTLHVSSKSHSENDPVGLAELARNLSSKDPKLSYSLYRFFVAYLIEKHGLEKFQQFLRSYTADPHNAAIIFEDTFGASLPQAVGDFADGI